MIYLKRLLLGIYHLISENEYHLNTC